MICNEILLCWNAFKKFSFKCLKITHAEIDENFLFQAERWNKQEYSFPVYFSFISEHYCPTWIKTGNLLLVILTRWHPTVFSPWFVNHVKLHAVAIQQVYVSIGEPMYSYCSTFWCACDNIESIEQVYSDIVAHSLALCWGYFTSDRRKQRTQGGQGARQ